MHKRQARAVLQLLDAVTQYRVQSARGGVNRDLTRGIDARVEREIGCELANEPVEMALDV